MSNMNTNDPELDALTTVWSALKPLDPDARDRILSWAAAKTRWDRMVQSGLITKDGELGDKFNGSQVNP